MHFTTHPGRAREGGQARAMGGIWGFARARTGESTTEKATSARSPGLADRQHIYIKPSRPCMDLSSRE
ncbi:hypothetical protein C8034_v010485 [Colletotrichum sidae]|uniref:Uncharacterized protein n=1 Tax=Colletotrichum sidae TaxID=1347389 RepID=A0A4R8T1P2_9PEZI|nr:hypothetical protein C8034_v010485 [Colletotrichum sidae]